jgi:hypothetical protein
MWLNLIFIIERRSCLLALDLSHVNSGWCAHTVGVHVDLKKTVHWFWFDPTTAGLEVASFLILLSLSSLKMSTSHQKSLKTRLVLSFPSHSICSLPWDTRRWSCSSLPWEGRREEKHFYISPSLLVVGDLVTLLLHSAHVKLRDTFLHCVVCCILLIN